MSFGGASYLTSGHQPRSADAQPPTPTPAPTPTPTATPAPTKTPTTFSDLPAPVRLGVRAASVQQQLAVIPTLVLVQDQAGYVAAIARWRTADDGAVRFPVLIDRGSYADQQRIARFVRAFKPQSVVRFKPGIEQGGTLPADRVARQRLIENAVASAWSAESFAKLNDRWKQLDFTPPGIVIAWAEDQAWTAALALSAGRGQPIAWVNPIDGGPGSTASEPDAQRFSTDIGLALKHTEFPYAQLGDAIDAVTLCQNLPVKVLLNDRDPRKLLALTDLVGRDKDGKRYAWTGQIDGDPAAAAYAAMCSLFLAPAEHAWLFDAYDDTKPWSLFDASDAGDKLSTAGLGISAVVDDPPAGGSLEDWRKRIAGAITPSTPAEPSPAAGFGIDARLICVNTSGNAEFFELKPGFGHSVDVPILRTPAAVHFVHSWSANNPKDRTHISAVWLERGAFAYVGSVHEPFLSAFVPTPLLATRLTAGLPWGAAVRIDNAEPWKVAVLGDPLYTLIARSPAKSGASLPLSGVEALDDAVPALLKDKKYALALRTLALLGRDRDAARLLSALIREEPVPMSRTIALAGIASAFATGDMETLIASAKVVLPEDPLTPARTDRPDPEADREVRDMVWHALWPARNALGKDGADLLLRALRPENLVADTRDLVQHVQSLRLTTPEPRQIVIAAQRMTSDRATIEALEKIGK